MADGTEGTIVLLVVVTVALGGLIVAFIGGSTLDRLREQRALKTARWECYVTSKDDDIVEVGVRKVAVWGSNRRVLKTSFMSRIVDGDIDAIIEAERQAIKNADERNSKH